MAQSKSVLLIMGSVRAGRICPRIAAWVAQLGREQTGLDYEVIDLAQWPLPMDDEAGIPARGHYSQPHTRAWSDKIRGADALVFVSPQYNGGYPAVLKNAIDHIYQEWRGKPALLVTYGGHGGVKCAEQLRQVFGAVKLNLVPTTPGLVLPEAVMREGATLAPGRDFQAHQAAIRQGLDELAGLLTASPPA